MSDQREPSSARKLCCILSPAWGCIGCDLQHCSSCANELTWVGWEPKCKYKYSANWTYDKNGHALAMIDQLMGFRVAERISKDIWRDGRVV